SATIGDTVHDHLVAGQALQHVLLTATIHGLAFLHAVPTHRGTRRPRTPAPRAEPTRQPTNAATTRVPPTRVPDAPPAGHRRPRRLKRSFQLLGRSTLNGCDRYQPESTSALSSMS